MANVWQNGHSLEVCTRDYDNVLAFTVWAADERFLFELTRGDDTARVITVLQNVITALKVIHERDNQDG